MKKTYNFSPGPAMLPQPVREKIKEEWLDWRGLGISAAEINHHSSYFKEDILQKMEKNLRELLGVPDNYEVLFLHGGAQLQFASVPMNLLGKNNEADYLVYGHWSNRACEEAERYGKINRINALATDAVLSITDPSQWSFNPNAAYLHCCSNETITGIRLPAIPESSAPLVIDMSSDILSAPIDVSKFGLIYACVQKNMGTVGMAIVIVRDDLLDQAMSITPSVINYKLQAERGSLFNTINTFSCYTTGLVLDWIKQEGGLIAMAALNRRKAEKLYSVIDESDGFYESTVNSAYRSIMNIMFKLPTKELDEQFVREAAQVGLVALKGHRISGGVRASIYNAMPEEGVDRLIEFMQAFKKQSHIAQLASSKTDQ